MTHPTDLSRGELRVLQVFSRYPRVTIDQATVAAGYPLTSRKYVAEALKKLSDREYLDSRRVPDDGTNVTPTMKRYWFPRQKGITTLKEAGYDMLPRIHHDPQRSAWMLNHDLAINDVLIACERFAGQHGGVVAVTHDEYLARDPLTVTLLGGKEVKLHADGFIGLSVHNQDYAFWLEVDRGTEHQSVWREKIEAIVRYAMSVGDSPLTVMVVETKGWKQLTDLVAWTMDQLTDMGLANDWGEIFRFAMIDSVSDPDVFLSGDTWVVPYTHELVPLVPSPA